MDALVLLSHPSSLPETLFFHTKSQWVFFVRTLALICHQIIDDHAVIVVDRLNFGVLVLNSERCLYDGRLATFKRSQTIHLLDLLFAQNLRMLIGQR